MHNYPKADVLGDLREMRAFEHFSFVLLHFINYLWIYQFIVDFIAI